ncbi:hypothetical protein SAMN05216436_13512 [bacterium A37T11]|nr:hypothetical protein SAMN05216436_13512 [bacterium A37T11]
MKMKTKKYVSETVPAGEVAGENVILFNHSNSNKMSTTKKVSSKMLVLFAAFLMAVGVGKAQEKTVAAVNAIEVVSSNAVPASVGISASHREVKSGFVVPAKLAKAMVTGKVGKGKGTKAETSKTAVNPVSRFITSNGSYNGTPTGDGCSEGAYYCGFTYDADSMSESDARDIAELNFASVNDGDEVDGVVIHKRPDFVWQPE